MDFRGTMEEQREVQAKELGLDTTEFAFYSILMAEQGADKAGAELDEILQQKVLRVTKELVQMLHDTVHIVDFFRKWDEQKRVKRNIKRVILNEFDDLELVNPVTDRFMELAEVKFQ